jgi:hypothetical protein
MTQETAAQNINNQLTSNNEKDKIEELKSKPIHGQFYRDLERPSVYKEKSLAWLYSSDLKQEMVSLITAAQDQALNKHYHQNNNQLIENAGCAVRRKTHKIYCCRMNTCTT